MTDHELKRQLQEKFNDATASPFASALLPDSLRPIHENPTFGASQLVGGNEIQPD